MPWPQGWLEGAGKGQGAAPWPAPRQGGARVARAKTNFKPAGAPLTGARGGLRGGLGGAKGNAHRRLLSSGLGYFLLLSIGGFLSENMGATQVAQWHRSALGAEFDHSPMAPPIVHPSNGVNHCRTSSASRHPRKRVGTA